MVNNGNNANCGFSDEIVSYIYDEIGAVERKTFEGHLTVCSVCTDEFAAISNARFTVFEWRREEFEPLATPEFSIPYAGKQYEADESTSAGFLAGLRGLLSVSGWPIAVAAGLVACLGLGLVAMKYLDSGQLQIASNVSVPPVNSPDNTKRDDSAVTLSFEPEPAVDTASTSNKNNFEQKPRPVKPMEIHTARPDRQSHSVRQRSTDRFAVEQNAKPQLRKAPSLSNFDENDDKSLRLSDLFDEEIGAAR